MSDKLFKTYDEQLAILKDRGLSLTQNSNENYSKTMLSNIGYYNLINGYGKAFIDTTSNKYINGTTIKEIYSLYAFDRKLRSIFLKYILTLEIKIKNMIAHVFSEKYGNRNYLIFSNFNNIPSNNSKITDLISNIHNLLSARTNDPCINHYLTNYGYIPLWVLNNILTFGVISKFYSLMKQNDKQQISREFSLSDNEFENLLLYLSPIRNFCAHGNRLYCYRTKKPLIDTSIHNTLSISRNSKGEYVLGKRDLFAACIALKYLLSKKDFLKFNKELYRAIGTFKKNITIIPPDTVLSSMGFPNNWDRLPNNWEQLSNN